MKKLLTISMLALGLALTGCATSDYELYAKSQVQIAQAQANAEAEKYKALAAIAASGDNSAKVAAVITMNMQGNGVANRQGTQIAQPRSAGDSALAWASILVPGITNMYAIDRNTKLGINQSNNAAAAQIATTEAFVGMAGKIQAPVVSVPQANVSTVTTNTNNTSTVTRDSGNTTSVVTRDSNNVTRDSGNTTTTNTTTNTENRSVVRDSNNQTTTNTSTSVNTNTDNRSDTNSTNNNNSNNRSGN